MKIKTKIVIKGTPNGTRVTLYKYLLGIWFPYLWYISVDSSYLTKHDVNIIQLLHGHKLLIEDNRE